LFGDKTSFGAGEEGFAALDRVTQGALAAGANVRYLELVVFQAVALDQSGRTQEALRTIDESLGRGKTDGTSLHETDKRALRALRKLIVA
jgi:hypothetical protein